MNKTVTILRDAGGIATALRSPVYLLTVIQGPDKGEELRSSSERVVVGSAPSAQLRLSDKTVSALHFEVVLKEEGFVIRDLGSKNGTFFGHYQVFDAKLDGAEEIRVGATTIRFRVLDAHEDRALGQRVGLGRLCGSSVRMRQLYEELVRVAQSDSAVLLSGATGTGKELCAETIVSEGPRKKAPFVVLDCPSLPTGLAESELFGHETGAFSGAAQMHRGAFERANGGTLFLDEVGELTPELQTKLLGILERRAVQRLGGEKTIPLDVRVISATQRDLERDINAGRFRADLYFRLGVLPIRLPTLAERVEDIPELIAHFLSKLPSQPRLRPEQIRQLCERDYPGNVLELKAAVERLALGLNLDPQQPVSSFEVNTQQPFQLAKERLVAQFEAAYINKILEECNWNVAEAARRSGINRTHFYRVVSRLKSSAESKG